MDILVKWRRLILTDIPECAGVYAFRLGKKRWLYIGKANNLKVRLNKQHIPLQIVQELYPDASLLYVIAKSPHNLENYLIAELEPLWNGGTSRSGGRFPSCDVSSYFSEVTDEDLLRAISVLHF